MRSPFHTTIGQFSSSGGRSQPRAANVRAVEPAPDLSGAERGNVYMLVEVTGQGGGHAALYRQILNAAQTSFYEAEGTLASALVRAVRSAHAALHRANEALPDAGWRAGMTCIALHEQELLIAQAGPALVLVAHPKTIDQFPSGPEEFTPSFGAEDRPEVELIRSKIEPGSLILMAQSDWLNRVPAKTLAAVAAVDNVAQVVEYLGQLCDDADLSALVIQIDSAAAAPRDSVPAPAATLPAGPSTPAPTTAAPRPTAHAATPASPTLESRPAPVEKDKAKEAPPSLRPERREPVGHKEAAPPVRAPAVRRTMSSVPAAVAVPVAPPPTPDYVAAERARPPEEPGMSTSGVDEERPRRSIWPLLLALVVIPLLIAVLVFGMWFFRNRASDDEFSRLLLGASTAAAEAQSLPDEDNARQRLNAAREFLDKARAMKADDPRLADVQTKYDEGVDRLNKVTPLYSVVPMWDFKGTGQRLERVVVNNNTLFVLDRGRQEINLFNLSELGDSMTPAKTPVVISRSLEVKDTVVGELVDVTWLNAVTNQRSKLLALDAGGGLVGYDTGFGVVKVPVAGREQWGYAQYIAAYNGNLYVVDTKANQIWRYTPTSNGYESLPEPYFTPGKEPDLAGVISIAIDGNIWLLYADGRLLKFFRGEQQEFATSGYVDSLAGAATVMAMENADLIYVADGSSGRIVEFNKQGKFQRQFRPALGISFKGMRHVYLDEAGSKFYILVGDKLYKADLPRPDPAPAGAS